MKRVRYTKYDEKLGKRVTRLSAKWYFQYKDPKTGLFKRVFVVDGDVQKTVERARRAIRLTGKNAVVLLSGSHAAPDVIGNAGSGLLSIVGLDSEHGPELTLKSALVIQTPRFELSGISFVRDENGLIDIRAGSGTASKCRFSHEHDTPRSTTQADDQLLYN